MSIPFISKEKLEELAKRIKPVVRFSRISNSKGSKLEEDEESGDLFYIKPVHPKNAFTWDAKPTRRASIVSSKPYTTIMTFHDYGFPLFFKPSVTEVLAQLPENELDICIAFETIYAGFSEGQRYHMAQTHLYKRRKKCH